MAPSKRTIRASEIGSFMYCQRAWWYQRQNTPTINTAELAGGESFHRRHVSRTAGARILKSITWILLCIALMILFYELGVVF